MDPKTQRSMSLTVIGQIKFGTLIVQVGRYSINTKESLNYSNQ